MFVLQSGPSNLVDLACIASLTQMDCSNFITAVVPSNGHCHEVYAILHHVCCDHNGSIGSLKEENAVLPAQG